MPVGGFFSYLKRNNVIALAVGVMIAKNISTLTESAVDNILNPMLDPIVQRLNNQVKLKDLKLEIGPFNINIGKFIGDILEFLLLGILIVAISKFAERNL